MDPQAAWLELARAFSGDSHTDWDRIEELADGLLHWLKRDGLPPNVTNNPAFDRLVVIQTCQALIDWNICV
jgi:hypothetical protein